jgi:Ser/Thr protein kinase RdoA (MazF antagonist)
MTRQNSVIHQIRCKQCGNRVVAKVGGGKRWRDDDRVQLQNEYATLCTLRSAFSGGEGVGILEPLGYMEVAGRGILVTHWFMGIDLLRYARGAETHALERAFRLAGAWLLKLHDADNEKRPMRLMGVAEKIEDLSHNYGGVLRTQPRAWKACELLASVGRGLEALAVQSVRIHGDFKPQNMLYDDTCCVGLDIHWEVIGAAVYDLAPFLNHLWLAGVGKQDLGAKMRYLQAETAFLAGYGDAVPTQALRWAQLYFALCHLGGYRRRGGLAVVYANLKIWPLLRWLEEQLWESA